MAKSKQQTNRKVQGRITRHKNVRYHNDAALFPDSVKICKQCNKPFENRKKWSSRGQWHLVQYCSRRCSKLAKSHISKSS
jgi:hypothetical protein